MSIQTRKMYKANTIQIKADKKVYSLQIYKNSLQKIESLSQYVENPDDISISCNQNITGHPDKTGTIKDIN